MSNWPLEHEAEVWETAMGLVVAVGASAGLVAVVGQEDEGAGEAMEGGDRVAVGEAVVPREVADRLQCSL